MGLIVLFSFPALAATEKLAAPTPKPSLAAAKSAAADDESVPYLGQAIFGFTDEIDPNDPETRKGIEQARRESGVKEAPPSIKDGETPSTEKL
jgi:hypothetical protein